MARMIKFPLDMGNDKRVRTIEELRENFNGEKLAAHFASGKLQTWLLDRHYQAEYERVVKLDSDSADFLRKLCAVLKIEHDVSDIKVEEVIEREKLVQELRQFTEDEEILHHLERVAVNQEQFDGLLNQEYSVIYLFGGEYEISANLKQVRILGIREPVLHVETDEVIDFEAAGVEIQSCRFDEGYCALMERKKWEEENAHKKRKRAYQVSKELDYRLSDEDRKKSEKLFNKIQDGLGTFEFDIDAGAKGIYKIMREADIWNLFDIDRYGADIRKSIKEANLDRTGAEFLSRIS